MATALPGANTLDVRDYTYTFNPLVKGSETGEIDWIMPAGKYYVYFAATDGRYRTLYQVYGDPFLPSGPTTITVVHSMEPTGDSDEDGDVDFEDFLAFVVTFGSQANEPNYNALFDLDQDGDVDFSDFLIFVGLFGAV